MNCDVGKAELILQPFHHFTYITAHSPTLRLFTYVTVHSPTLPLLHLHHSSFSNPSYALPTSQLILQTFHCFTYITTHSQTLLLLYLRHRSFSNPPIASPMSQFILQPFFCFSYITSSSLNSPGELPMMKAVLISTVRSYGWSF